MIGGLFLGGELTLLAAVTALGKYQDMLLASARHPAMLRYLNNADSDRRNVNVSREDRCAHVAYRPRVTDCSLARVDPYRCSTRRVRIAGRDVQGPKQCGCERPAASDDRSRNHDRGQRW